MYYSLAEYQGRDDQAIVPRNLLHQLSLGDYSYPNLIQSFAHNSVYSPVVCSNAIVTVILTIQSVQEDSNEVDEAMPAQSSCC